MTIPAASDFINLMFAELVWEVQGDANTYHGEIAGWPASYHYLGGARAKAVLHIGERQIVAYVVSNRTYWSTEPVTEAEWVKLQLYATVTVPE